MSKLNARLPAAARRALVFLTDWTLVFLAVFGTVFSFTSAYRVEVRTPFLLGACVCCSLLSAVLFSLSKGRLWALAAVGAAYALALYRLWQTLCSGMYHAYIPARNLLAERLGLFVPAQMPAAFAAADGRESATIWLAFALAALAVFFGWSAAYRRCAALTIAVTFLSVLPALLAEVEIAALPLLSLVVLWTAMLLTSRFSVKARSARAYFTALALPVSAALVCLLVFFSPREEYVRPRWTQEAERGLITLGGRLSRFWVERFPSAALEETPSALTGSAEAVDLTAAGPMRYTGRTVLRVWPGEPGRTLLRGYSAAVYTGTAWLSLDDARYEALSTRLDLGGAGQPAFFPALLGSDGSGRMRLLYMTVENVAAPGGAVYAPYYPSGILRGIEGAYFVNDTHLAPADGVWSHTIPYLPALIPAQPLPVDWPSADAERIYRDFVYEAYLGVPDGFRTLIAPWLDEAARAGFDLTRVWTPGTAEETLAAAEMVADALAATTAYDLDAPRLPAGEDFAAYFLNTSRRGYCMHYASAAALLLRAGGIPARYVSGYAATFDDLGQADIPDSAAHAWVEVYIDGFGWHPVEVTPAAAAENSITNAPGDELPEETPADTPEEDAAPETAAPEEANPPPAGEPPAASSPAAESAGRPAAYALFTAGLILLAALPICARALARRRRRARFGAADTNRAALAAYRYLQRLGRWGAQTDENTERLARRARFSQHVLTEEERSALVRYAAKEARRVDRTLSPVMRFLFRYVCLLY